MGRTKVVADEVISRRRHRQVQRSPDEAPASAERRQPRGEAAPTGPQQGAVRPGETDPAQTGEKNATPHFGFVLTVNL